MATYHIHGFRESFQASTDGEIISYLASKGYYTSHHIVGGEDVFPLYEYKGRNIRLNPPKAFVEDLLKTGFLVEGDHRSATN